MSLESNINTTKMTSKNLEDVYNDINYLLNDICKFLNTEIQNGSMSQEAQLFARNLVKRSQEKVDVIKKISSSKYDSNINYPYLHMGGPEIDEEMYVDADADIYEETGNLEEEEYAKIDVEISNTFKSTEKNDNPCPYFESSYLDISPEAKKCGPLYRKERYFIIEQKKLVHAALVENWFLVYYSGKRNTKPFLTINVQEYNANRLEQKKELSFEITCSKKKYEFIARTYKELDQWITILNYFSRKDFSNIYIRNLPEIPSNNNKCESNICCKNEEGEKIDGSLLDGQNENVIEEDYDEIYENVEGMMKMELAKSKDISILEAPNNDIITAEEEDIYDFVKDNDDFEDDDGIYYDPKELILPNQDEPMPMYEEPNQRDPDMSENTRKITATRSRPPTLPKPQPYKEDEYNEILPSPKIKQSASKFDVVERTENKLKLIKKPLLSSKQNTEKKVLIKSPIKINIPIIPDSKTDNKPKQSNLRNKSNRI